MSPVWKKNRNRILCCLASIPLIAACQGCVERMITVKTTPPGAIVWLNGEEIGAAPVTRTFTWYGEYEVIIRQEGFETLKTSRKIDAPVYQWPVIDLFTECLLPFHFVDRQEWEFELAPQTPTDTAELIQRAKDLREKSLYPPVESAREEKK